MRRGPLLEYSVVGLPLVVAVLHLILVETTSQTRWKGGGFGMYADPHPNSHRAVWLSGRGKTGSEQSFSLDPLDDRVILRTVDARRRRRQLVRLHRLASNGKNYPELMELDALSDTLRELLADEGDDPDLRTIVGLLPISDVRLRVVEIQIDPRYQRLVANSIYEAPLP